LIKDNGVGFDIHHKKPESFGMIGMKERVELLDGEITFESKIGKLIYALAKYQKLNRVTIPINENYFLLIALDAEVKDFDSIIMEKIIPLIKKEKHNFGNSHTIDHE
jgi:hypothetical protein